MNTTIRSLTLGGVIAALYVALTLLLAPVSYGMLQCRVSEVLTVMPLFSFAAVPGLTLGCLISNLMNPQSLGIIDIVFGTLATCLASFLTYTIGRVFHRVAKVDRAKSRRLRVLALVPPVLCNALIVGTYLPFLLMNTVTVSAVLLTILSIALSESVVVFGLGLPLAVALDRMPKTVFSSSP